MPSSLDLLFEKFHEHSSNGFAVGVCFVSGQPMRSKFTYRSDFLAAYTNADMAQHDATLHFGFSKNGCVTWQDLVASGGDTRSFELAKSFGIDDGVCISVEANGRKSIGSISRPAGDYPDQSVIDELTNLMIEATFDVEKILNNSNVSQRTIDLIQAYIDGAKDDDDLSKRLNLSVRGARNRRRLALEELEAENPTQALYFAIKRGIIKP